jgi:hypothetical protein
VLLPLALLAACEGVSHDNIEKWVDTKKGPAKLKEALEGDYDADLRAHAAERLIVARGDLEVVRASFDAMGEADRQAVLAALAPRLWEQARVEHTMVPNTTQATAKDAMFYLRKHGDAATAERIDEYLVEWYTGGQYEGCAQSGAVTGAMVMRELGPKAASRLLAYARGIVARPPDANGRRAQVGSETLKALALTGDKSSLTFLMELYRQPRGDVRLPQRVIDALHFAYVEPVGFPPADGKALVNILTDLEGIALDRGASGKAINDAVDLLGTLGPDCTDSFVRIIAYDHPREAFRWMGVQKGIRCGGPAALRAIAEALPTKLNYERGYLQKYLWDELAAFPAPEVAQAARSLLESSSWVARVTGLELLASTGKPAIVAEDIQKIRALAKDRKVLQNWWGDQSKLPKGERKTDPQLGQLAQEVAKSLEDVAKETGSE